MLSTCQRRCEDWSQSSGVFASWCLNVDLASSGFGSWNTCLTCAQAGSLLDRRLHRCESQAAGRHCLRTPSVRSGRPTWEDARILGSWGSETVFADVTAVTADCDCCKTRRKDAGGVWGQGGQVWDDYRVSIHVINLRMFAHVGILIPWVVGNLPSGIVHTENKVYTIIGTRN